MLFNSYPFIFIFLPISLLGYFALHRLKQKTVAQAWLALSSIFFYGWWNVQHVPLLLGSILFNYFIGRMILRAGASEAVKMKKWVLMLGLLGNILLLGYYKYRDFLILNWNELTGSQIGLLQLVLPLGISFFTFTQIAYLVDCYRGMAKSYGMIDYVLFVTFYPHLIAGPIIHHREMMPQFEEMQTKRWDWTNVSHGCFLFCIGLFKKVVIADTFAGFADIGFMNAAHFFDSWAAALSYTIQLYFDFSGYSDMAIGLALFFNVRLPQNFDSPYKARSIQDFWQRWHMTLSRYLRDYIYIPLGGNRKGTVKAIRNTIITFVIGGLWHGAGWTFIVWGLMHGLALAVHRLWNLTRYKLPGCIAWGLTFLFINVTWVVFRAENGSQAIRILKGMFGLQGIESSISLSSAGVWLAIMILLPIIYLAPNSTELNERLAFRRGTALAMAAFFVISLLFLNRITTFLYFNF
ncbi:MBOAT family O-acyltransferase [Paenibacillus sp. 1001270B_150601_E10]|uniref:MBOAT family O-acyltransferase n=1 Tax=Paenibacillus sp. 1001270B_150601_E10 TaxID=2787079 RepID=UPI00189C65FA|nr:MBOAT family protein [Paenibacillus sp. 1001270B_150601_E10]